MSLAIKSNRHLIILLSLFYGLLHLFFAAYSEFGNSSEAREGHVIWSLLKGDNWILPLRNGIIPSKPPLFHWIGAMFGYIFNDVTPWIARLPSVFAAAGVVYLTLNFINASWVKMRRQSASPQMIWLGWFILSTTYCFVANTADAKVDMVFCFWTTLAITGWIQNVLFDRSIAAVKSGYLIFFVACSFAILAKGPLGIALPFFICFSIASLFNGFVRSLQSWLAPRWVWILPLIIALPWYIAALLKGGGDFAARQIFFENIQRILGSKEMNSEVWWFYLPSLLRTAAPWSVAFIYLALKCWPSKMRVPGITIHEDKKVPFVGVVWVLAGVIFFSIPSGKRHSYLLPMMPGLISSIVLILLADFTRIIDICNAALERGDEL